MNKRLAIAKAKLLLACLLFVVLAYQTIWLVRSFAFLSEGLRNRRARNRTIFSPHLARNQCDGFHASANIFDDLSSSFTSFYPHHLTTFLDDRPNSRSSVCEQATDVRLFVAITSRPDGFEKREAIRETFLSKGACKDRIYEPHRLTCAQIWSQTRFAFFTGLDRANRSVNDRVTLESATHGDVVRLSKLERYDDLSAKSLAVLHWVSQFCTQTQYLAKVDDDSLINLGSILNLLDAFAVTREHFIAGQVQHNPRLNRDPNSAYYTPESVLPGAPENLPPYAFGCGYIMPFRTAKLLYEAGRCVAMISIEDLFFTGLLRDSLNISLIALPCVNCFRLSIDKTVCNFDAINILHHVGASAMRTIWMKLLKPEAAQLRVARSECEHRC